MVKEAEKARGRVREGEGGERAEEGGREGGRGKEGEGGREREGGREGGREVGSR